MEDIIYIKSGLAEIANFASMCIRKQIPVSCSGGIELRTEPRTDQREWFKKCVLALKRRAEKNGHVFSVEAYLNDGAYGFDYDEKYLEK